MRRGDAKPRRAARLMTHAGHDPLERAGRARARLARSAVPEGPSESEAFARLGTGEPEPQVRVHPCDGLALAAMPPPALCANVQVG